MPDINDIMNQIENEQSRPKYPNRINFLANEGMDTSIIEKGIGEAESIIQEGNDKSFVIYGEPQSGKTEVMIALTFKLVDMGFKTIFLVMNDITELEKQNYKRFLDTDLNPSPIQARDLVGLNTSELKEETVRIIFCRKNAQNLSALIQNCRYMKNRIIIDDEADYASPNGMINVPETTRINECLEQLGNFTNASEKYDGYYIGVTATPGRLDLNNTFRNNSKKWIYLDSHKKYKGQSFFFPLTLEDKKNSDYQLRLLSDRGDNPAELDGSILRFLLRTSFLNLNDETKGSYSMLIHTAGRVNDHDIDKSTVDKAIYHLKNPTGIGRRLTEKMLEEAGKLFPEENISSKVIGFLLTNVGKSKVLIINSRQDRDNVERACTPKNLYTFAIGGNIVSRGLTFKNLLTFFFSRSVKGRLQQNTYIQRARMFGVRPYSKYFELTIPKTLYQSWADCFQDHELSIKLGKSGNLVHIERSTNRAVDAGVIDKENVVIGKREREVGEIFSMNEEIENILINSNENALDTIKKLKDKNLLNDNHFAPEIIKLIEETSLNLNDDCVMVLTKRDNSIFNIEDRKDGDPETIRRARGGVIQSLIRERPRYANKTHYILPVKNAQNKARFLYRQSLGQIVLQNVKNN